MEIEILLTIWYTIHIMCWWQNSLLQAFHTDFRQWKNLRHRLLPDCSIISVLWERRLKKNFVRFTFRKRIFIVFAFPDVFGVFFRKKNVFIFILELNRMNFVLPLNYTVTAFNFLQSQVLASTVRSSTLIVYASQ